MLASPIVSAGTAQLPSTNRIAGAPVEHIPVGT